ncbi:protein of unknown function DUF742 [Actinobacteria bacterium OK074]|nr:protein of unknown function DUF742 [Actinobacteria bacterium OK074]
MADGHTPADEDEYAGETGYESAETGYEGTDDYADLGPDPVVRPAPAVRPFLVTAGRVAGNASGRPIPVETQVVATPAGLDSLEGLSFEQHDIVAACRRPQSIAEIAARLRLHLNVVRVLAEDLRSAGQLSVYVPHTDITRDASVLRRVIDGLRAIPDSRGVLP